MITITVLAALAPKLEIQDEDKVISNPIGLEALGNVEQSLAGSVLFVIFICSLAGAFASLVVRFRRSEGEERQQLKWFTYAGALATLLPITFGLPLPGVSSDLIFALVLAFLPIATGIAILKYRLYDIDVIINRTLVYGGLTATLALVYVAGVVVLGGSLRAVTGQTSNNVAVAASTLGVAALFGPARSRIQSFIDRRFYRRRYDAARTLESFSARLREEVELRTLTAHLLTAVRDTVQPAHVSLWLRGDQASHKTGPRPGSRWIHEAERVLHGSDALGVRRCGARNSPRLSRESGGPRDPVDLGLLGVRAGFCNLRRAHCFAPTR